MDAGHLQKEDSSTKGCGDRKFFPTFFGQDFFEQDDFAGMSSVCPEKECIPSPK